WLSSEKRPLLWIDSAAKIREQLPNSKFLLCGVGSMQPEIEARIVRLGLTDNVRLLGARNDIQTIFMAADLVMQSSLQEGTPNTLIEAQAMGIPVVTTPAFGAAEAVAHGTTGIVVRDESAMGIAKAALTLLSDPMISATVRDIGPKFIEGRFG